ncbi:MAG: TIGR04255 family protein [Thiothrix sp.]|uniref:TIGR04255 family protein n=1 Tax=Thiothrix sp. TaxID=1032 RepID=UPI0026384D46|nr:TIGR04255 family protein [Thiothrix sp.]MDD5393164.1 TIGR04255 family protein [Thiothrix sp.]
MDNLPIKLEKQPIIDGLFEIRFVSSSVVRLGSILPGLLFASLEGEKSLATLPLNQFPEQMRDSDQNLKYLPIHRMDWGKFYINIGDHAISVGFKYPYPGWGDFKKAIMDVMMLVLKSGVIQTIDKYMIKAVNLISSDDIGEQVSFTNLNVKIANYALKENFFSVQLEIPSGDFLHNIKLLSSATAKIHTNEEKHGLIIDISTISNVNALMTDVMDGLPLKLEDIHTSSKRMFFSCLTPETLDGLGPIYE